MCFISENAGYLAYVREHDSPIFVYPSQQSIRKIVLPSPYVTLYAVLNGRRGID